MISQRHSQIQSFGIQESQQNQRNGLRYQLCAQLKKNKNCKVGLIFFFLLNCLIFLYLLLSKNGYPVKDFQNTCDVISPETCKEEGLNFQMEEKIQVSEEEQSLKQNNSEQQNIQIRSSRIEAQLEIEPFLNYLDVQK